MSKNNLSKVSKKPNFKLYLIAGSTFLIGGLLGLGVTTFAAPSPAIKEAIENKDFAAYQEAVTQKQVNQKDRQHQNPIKNQEDFDKLVKMKELQAQAKEAKQGGNLEKAKSLRAEADTLRKELGLPSRKAGMRGRKGKIQAMLPEKN